VAARLVAARLVVVLVVLEPAALAHLLGYSRLGWR